MNYYFLLSALLLLLTAIKFPLKWNILIMLVISAINAANWIAHQEELSFIHFFHPVTYKTLFMYLIVFSVFFITIKTIKIIIQWVILGGLRPFQR